MRCCCCLPHPHLTLSATPSRLIACPKCGHFVALYSPVLPHILWVGRLAKLLLGFLITQNRFTLEARVVPQLWQANESPVVYQSHIINIPPTPMGSLLVSLCLLGGLRSPLRHRTKKGLGPLSPNIRKKSTY